MHRWFDSTMKGIDTGIMKEPPVKIFVMGENVWRYENEWPLARTKYTKYYLQSGGRANSKSGDGSLVADMPRDASTDRFVYDPENPVPSMPDSSTFDDFRYYPTDHSRLEGREDILVYSTPPLERDTEVTGPVEMILHAASSAVNTDFTGKLLDVYPDGRAIFLCDGIIRASFRGGQKPSRTFSPEKSTNTASFSIPPATCSKKAIESVWRYHRAISRDSTVISTRAGISPRQPNG